MGAVPPAPLVMNDVTLKFSPTHWLASVSSSTPLQLVKLPLESVFASGPTDKAGALPVTLGAVEKLLPLPEVLMPWVSDKVTLAV